jgi:mevalonate kinase
MSLQRDEAHVGRGSGKVILLGEHAVVHGVPALAAGLSKGSRAHTSHAQDEVTKLEVAPWNVCVSRHDELPLARAFDALLKARREGSEEASDRSVSAAMEIPGSAGLGSSAALGVAVLRALDAHDGITRGYDDAQRVALAWERVFHGNPSGVDTAMAIAGGVAVYRRAPQAGPCGLALRPRDRVFGLGHAVHGPRQRGPPG